MRHKFNRAERACHETEFAANALGSVDDGPAVYARDGRHLAYVAAGSVFTVMALHRRRDLRRDDHKKPGHKYARRSPGSSCLRIRVSHRAGDFARPASDALFRITLYKGAELFRCQGSCSMAKLGARDIIGRAGISAEVIVLISCGIHPVLAAASALSTDLTILLQQHHIRARS